MTPRVINHSRRSLNLSDFSLNSSQSLLSLHLDILVGVFV